MIRESELPIDQILEEAGVFRDMIGSPFVEAILKHFCEGFSKVDDVRRARIALIDSSEEKTRIRFPELLPIVAAKGIPLVDQDGLKQTVAATKTFFLREMGDPRLPKRPGGWLRAEEINADSVRIFRKWLAEEDLEFFFRLVDETAKDRQWRYRRAFWSAYLPDITATWVILGSRAHDLARTPQMRAYLKRGNFGLLQGAVGGQSCFWVQLGDRSFIEWSHDAACRVWQDSNVPVSIGQTIYYRSDFFTGTHVERFEHRGAEEYRWQDRLAQWIQKETGIRPSSSYYLR